MSQSSDQLATTPEREKFPAHLTFSQRYGYEPLPEPMRLGHLSNDLRRKVYDAICHFLKHMIPEHYDLMKEISQTDKDWITCVLAKIQKIPETDIYVDYREVSNLFKPTILKGEFHQVLSCLEIIFNESHIHGQYITPSTKIISLRKEITLLFDQYNAAYWLNISQPPYWFFPRTSKEEGEAVQQAIEIIHQGGMNGAVTHLRKAAKFINTGDHSDSIRESMNTVESIARTIDPASSKTLAPALKSLENKGLLKHTALKEAFIKLYGYTSDEQGIRHPLLDQNLADVGLDEALFMFGACASFAAYLTRKDQQRRQDP